MMTEAEGFDTEFLPEEVPSLTLPFPERLLRTSDKEIVFTQTMHAATLFSEGVVDEEGEIRQEILEYLRAQQEQGVTHLYTIGLWRTSVFSELVMPYWANECWPALPDNLNQIGGSCFSGQDYVPCDLIGSWENLAKVQDAAKELGIKIVGDLVTNTIALDSEVAIHHPEFIEGEELNELPAELQAVECEWTQVYPYSNTPAENWPENQKTTNWDGNIQTHELQVFRQGNEEMVIYDRIDTDVEDNVLLKYRIYLPQTRGKGKDRGTSREFFTKVQKGGERRIFKQSVGRMGEHSADLWADTAWLNSKSPEMISWMAENIARIGTSVDVIRFDMAHLKNQKFWEELFSCLENCNVGMWAEAYGDTAELQKFMDKIYYADIAKLLRKRNVREIMNRLRDSSFIRYLQEYGLEFIANHDEKAELSHLQLGAAMAIIGSMPGGILLAQGQTEGLLRRISADTNIPLRDYNEMTATAEAEHPVYASFMSRLSKVISKAVFRSSESEFREPEVELRYNGSGECITNGRYDKVFRSIRQLGEDRVFSVINYQDHRPGEQIVVKVRESFPDVSDLENYSFVNLITGEVILMEDELVLNPLRSKDGIYPGYDVHMYALVRNERLEGEEVQEP